MPQQDQQAITCALGWLGGATINNSRGLRPAIVPILCNLAGFRGFLLSVGAQNAQNALILAPTQPENRSWRQH